MPRFHHTDPLLKTLIESLLKQALDALPEEVLPLAGRDIAIEVENTRDAQHGDFASNLAMRLAKSARQNPRKLAEALLRVLPADDAIVKVEIAGAGSFHLPTRVGAPLSCVTGFTP